jgi:hypothetical protein
MLIAAEESCFSLLSTHLQRDLSLQYKFKLKKSLTDNHCNWSLGPAANALYTSSFAQQEKHLVVTCSGPVEVRHSCR